MFIRVVKQWNNTFVEAMAPLSLEMLKPKRRPKQHSQTNTDVILLQSYSPFSFVRCPLVYLITVVVALCMIHASKYVHGPCQCITALNSLAPKVGQT